MDTTHAKKLDEKNDLGNYLTLAGWGYTDHSTVIVLVIVTS